MDAKQNILLSCAATAVSITINRRRRRRAKERRKREWVKDWVSKRVELGAYHSLFQEFQQSDIRQLRNFLRMDMDSFLELLVRVEPKIRKEDTNMRLAIPPGERLALTLRFLATGRHTIDFPQLFIGNFTGSLLWIISYSIFTMLVIANSCTF